MGRSRASRFVAVACAVACVLALAGCAGGASAPSEAAGITVTGKAEVKVVPDKARISVSVTTEGADAQSCQEANAAAVNDVIAALEAQGVAEESIQTSYSDLWPRYGSVETAADDLTVGAEGTAEDAAISIADVPTIAGYEMTTSLSVSDLDIDAVGGVVQAAVAAGATGTDGISYYASSYDEAYDQALQDALAAAREKAEVIADSAGVSLGKATSVQEGYQDVSARYEAADALYVAADAGSAKTMPGEVAVSASLTVTYAIG